MGGNMKVHKYEFPSGLLTRSNCWDQQSQLETHSPSGFSNNTVTAISFDLKAFVKTPNKTCISLSNHKITDQPTQTETTTWQAAGGTRWNPTQEQIGILEKLYKGGMRTPNGQEIEKITAHLGKYGKIEGKNVFYWFQNHKARQRQKLNRLKYNMCQPTCSSTTTTSTLNSNMEDEEIEENVQMKRKRSRSFIECEQRREKGHKTLLQLFPLHPEGR